MQPSIKKLSVRRIFQSSFQALQKFARFSFKVLTSCAHNTTQDKMSTRTKSPRTSPRRSQSSQPSSQAVQGPSMALINPALQAIQSAKKSFRSKTFSKLGSIVKQALKVQVEVIMLKLVREELLQTDGMAVLEDIEIADLEGDDTAELERNLSAYEKASEEKRAKYAKEELTPAKLKKHPDYLEFMKIIDKKFKEIKPPRSSEGKANDTQDILDDDDDEGEMPNSGVIELIPALDPITRLPLKDPVRNNICLHVYGKEGIYDLLKQNKKVRCPQLGCSNRQFIRRENLFVDPELSEKVKQRAIENQRREAEKAAEARKEKAKNRGRD